MVLLQFFVYFEYAALDFAFRDSGKIKRTAKVSVYLRVSLEAFYTEFEFCTDIMGVKGKADILHSIFPFRTCRSHTVDTEKPVEETKTHFGVLESWHSLLQCWMHGG